MTTTIEELATLPALHTTDTVVIRNPLELEKGVETTLYVTSTETGSDAHNLMVGTYQPVVGAWSGDGWLNSDGAIRLYGAPLNPVPRDGHHYRILGGFVVRFNENAEDRNAADMPYSIVAGVGGVPWPFPNDATSSLVGTHWVEIEWEVSTGRQDDAPADGAPAVVLNTIDGVLLGLGKEVDGVVALDPDRVSGRQYLLWADDGDPGNSVKTATFLDSSISQDGWHLEGGYLRHGEEARFSTSHYRMPDGVLHWAELALVDPAPKEESIAALDRAELRRKIATAEQEWESFDEALNELATDKGWCEEFEDIVKPLGLTGRTGTYDVEVEVDFTMEDDSPSSHFDERLSSEYDLNISANTVTISGRATVTLYGITLRNPEEASNDISNSDVEDALNNALSGACVTSVDDWSVESWESSSS